MNVCIHGQAAAGLVSTNCFTTSKTVTTLIQIYNHGNVCESFLFVIVILVVFLAVEETMISSLLNHA